MTNAHTSPDSSVDACYDRLNNAVRAGRAKATCHRYWSKFIRARDGNECLICGTRNRLAAHHVVRRGFLKEAQYLTGNGATLCVDCHGEAHVGFNGSPDLSLPVDAEGGEKLEAVAELFRELAKSSRQRHPERDEFYFLSKPVLRKFKVMQGFDPLDEIAGKPIEQAWHIWDCAPLNVVEALIRANLPTDSVA